MPDVNTETFSGEFTSPGGFVFGVQGWTWGEQRPTSITFMMNGHAKVCDQHGRPIKGVVTKDGKPIFFDKCSHAQTIAALAEERVDWQTLTCAGWPQLPYEELQKVKMEALPPLQDTDEERRSYLNQLGKIPDKELRRAAIKFRGEMDELRKQEIKEALDG